MSFGAQGVELMAKTKIIKFAVIDFTKNKIHFFMFNNDNDIYC